MQRFGYEQQREYLELNMERMAEALEHAVVYLVGLNVLAEATPPWLCDGEQRWRAVDEQADAVALMHDELNALAVALGYDDEEEETPLPCWRDSLRCDAPLCGCQD